MTILSKKQRALLAAGDFKALRGTQKPRTPIKRTSWLKHGTKPIARSKIKAKPRTASEFNRIYGSRARVRWVKSLCCVYCAALNPFIGLASAGKSENAHVGKVGAGMSRKANADQIAPLCNSHHRRFDQHLAPFDDPKVREIIERSCVEVERMWQEHLAEVAA